MVMKLDRLALLHQDMATQGIIKQRFDFRFRTLQFSVVYIAEHFPHNLLFGCFSHDLFFVLEVKSNYEVAVYLGDSYKPLVDALKLRYNPDNRFSPRIFFEEFCQAIPVRANVYNIPTMTEVAALSRDIDEADKIHFCGWLPHDGIKTNVSAANLQKTRRLCGVDAHDVCSKHNISSRWTDDATKAKAYVNPSR